MEIRRAVGVGGADDIGNADNAQHTGDSGGKGLEEASGTSRDDLLTVEQAAQLLQLSPSSIRSYIRQGTLKAFRIGGLRKVRIAHTDLLSLLQPTTQSNTSGDA
jgi:excisionase family DNA binding protein